MSGPVCCMVWVGMGAVKTGRVMLGATKPSDSAPGTIRGDFAIDVGRNICHGSDAVESAGILYYCYYYCYYYYYYYYNLYYYNLYYFKLIPKTITEKEIALWFPEGLNEWNNHSKPWIYERI